MPEAWLRGTHLAQLGGPPASGAALGPAPCPARRPPHPAPRSAARSRDPLPLVLLQVQAGLWHAEACCCSPHDAACWRLLGPDAAPGALPSPAAYGVPVSRVGGACCAATADRHSVRGAEGGLGTRWAAAGQERHRPQAPGQGQQAQPPAARGSQRPGWRAGPGRSAQPGRRAAPRPPESPGQRSSGAPPGLRGSPSHLPPPRTPLPAPARVCGWSGVGAANRVGRSPGKVSSTAL